MATHGEYNPKKSLIRVLRNKEMDIHLVALTPRCNFCGECVKACLPGAITFTDTETAIREWKGIKVGSFPAPLLGSDEFGHA
jgi:ferredoxin